MNTFEQLKAAVIAIVNHTEVAEKKLALEECLDDVDGRYFEGSLTAGQKRRLLAILLGVEPPVARASHPSTSLNECLGTAQ
jgi:hypothetical protein